MPTSYRYRLLKGASWGIAITLTGDSCSAQAVPPGAVPIDGRVWLDLRLGWQPGEDEIRFLRDGLRLVARNIQQARPGELPILVRLTGLEFNPCDYQPEGLAAAAAGWAAEEFGFAGVDIPAEFDRTRRRYIYSFSSLDPGRREERTREDPIDVLAPPGT